MMALAAVVAVGLIGATTLFNAIVDPFDITRWLVLGGFNAEKPALQTRVRLAKAIKVRRLKPDEIVLGTSRSHVGIRMSHPGWPPGVGYNLGFDGATPEEMYAYLRHAAANRSMRLVVLGLDTWQIVGNPTSVRPDFDPNLLDDPETPWRRLWADLDEARYLTSLDAVQASLETLEAQGAPAPTWFAPSGQRLGEVFFRRPGEDYETKGPTAYFLAVDREEVGFKLPSAARAPIGPIRGRPRKPTDSFDYIRKIVEFCRDRRVELKVFITPAHAHQMEISALMGEWLAIEQGKRRLVKLLASAGAVGTTPPFELWDFSGYSSVTTEPLPPAASRQEMRFYWDSSHFKQGVGDWVLDRLFRVARSEHPVPADFGQQLTPQTVAAVLASIRQGRDAYERSHGPDIALLRGYIAAAKAGQAGSIAPTGY